MFDALVIRNVIVSFITVHPRPADPQNSRPRQSLISKGAIWFWSKIRLAFVRAAALPDGGLSAVFSHRRSVINVFARRTKEFYLLTYLKKKYEIILQEQKSEKSATFDNFENSSPNSNLIPYFQTHYKDDQN